MYSKKDDSDSDGDSVTEGNSWKVESKKDKTNSGFLAAFLANRRLAKPVFKTDKPPVVPLEK